MRRRRWRRRRREGAPVHCGQTVVAAALWVLNAVELGEIDEEEHKEKARGRRKVELEGSARWRWRIVSF